MWPENCVSNTSNSIKLIYFRLSDQIYISRYNLSSPAGKALAQKFGVKYIETSPGQSKHDSPVILSSPRLHTLPSYTFPPCHLSTFPPCLPTTLPRGVSVKSQGLTIMWTSCWWEFSLSWGSRGTRQSRRGLQLTRSVPLTQCTIRQPLFLWKKKKKITKFYKGHFLGLVIFCLGKNFPNFLIQIDQNFLDNNLPQCKKITIKFFF